MIRKFGLDSGPVTIDEVNFIKYPGERKKLLRLDLKN